MKSDYINIILTLAIGLLAACSSNDDELTRADNGRRVPLEIVAGIDVQAKGITRAAETSWEVDDKIGVYMTSYRTFNIFTDGDGTRGENLEYTYGDGTNYETWIANDHVYRLFIPSSKNVYLSSTSIDVYGYYPYKTPLANPRDYAIDVSNQTDQKALDFMTAKHDNINNTYNAIELLFQHRLVKLVFNLRQGDGLLTDELANATFHEFSIDKQPTTASYNIFTSTLSIVASSSNISPVKKESPTPGYDLTYEAIILPNGENNAASNRTVTITFYKNADDKVTNTFIIDNETAFEEGCKYVYNVTVNATSITVDPEKFTDQW